MRLRAMANANHDGNLGCVTAYHIPEMEHDYWRWVHGRHAQDMDLHHGHQLLHSSRHPNCVEEMYQTFVPLLHGKLPLHMHQICFKLGGPAALLSGCSGFSSTNLNTYL